MFQQEAMDFGDSSELLGSNVNLSSKGSCDFNSRSYQKAFAKRKEELAFKGSNQSLFDEVKADAEMYISGVCSISDLKGCIKSNMNVCVNVVDISKNATEELIKYLNTENGGKVFIDSGAFRIRKKDQQLDFTKVITYYFDVIHRAKYKDRIIVCAPDVVGDQKKSLDLQNHYQQDLKSMICLGVKVIFPLQKGDLLLNDMYLQICNEFGMESVIAGLPSNASSISINELSEFLRKKPKRVHLLGANKEKQIVKRALFESPSTIVTCDSNRPKSFIGIGQPLTDLTKDLKKDVINLYEKINENSWGEVCVNNQERWIPIDYNCIDYTEFDAEEVILSFSKSELDDLCDKLDFYMCELQLSPDKLRKIATNSNLIDVISEEYSFEFAYMIHDLVWNYYFDLITEKLTPCSASPVARTQAIHLCCENHLFN